MQQFISSDLKLGIICGGQLGKMLGLAAANWDITTYVLDAVEGCPASKVCNKHIIGHHMDYDAVYNFGQQVDMITFEIERVNLDALRKLKSEGKKIYPDPELLATIQDKGLQKRFYEKHDIPTAPFRLHEGKEEVLNELEKGSFKYPFVQKSRTDGYDGKGVAVISSQEKLHLLMDGPCVIEDGVNIKKELSVIIARNRDGEKRTFPIVDMEFNEEANLVEMLVCPADVSEEVTKKCVDIAHNVAEKLDLVGLLAVELFLDKEGNILVNESAPRTHNSGHHTIDNNFTSQFEQQIRAVLNLPLGDTSVALPAVMLNLIGEEGHQGDVFYEGFSDIIKIRGVKPYIYGKRETRPFRKMGHINIVADTIEDAKAKAKEIKNKIKAVTK